MKRIYIAPLLKYLTLKALRYGSQHSVTCKLHRTCLYFVSIHQMTHPRLRLRTSNCSLLLIYLPRKDERLSWPGKLLQACNRCLCSILHLICTLEYDVESAQLSDCHFYPHDALHSAVFAIVRCLVCLSVCLSHASIVSKRLDLS